MRSPSVTETPVRRRTVAPWWAHRAPGSAVRPLLASLFLLSGILGTAPRLAAADFVVLQSTFLPNEYYVGDEVELRITLRTPFADSLQVPATLPEVTWGRIQSVTILKDREDPEVRLRFTSFNPGIRTLPSLNLGPVILEKLNINVSSLIHDENTMLEPPRDMVFLPGTSMLLVLQCFIFLALPAALWLGFLKGRPLFRRMLDRYREGLPYRHISRSLAGISASMEAMDARSFYIQILQETRMYLHDRMGIPAISATTSELTQYLGLHVEDPDVRDHLTGLFRHGDRVKFAKEPASLGVRLEELRQLEASLRHVEHCERLRRRAAEHREREGKNHVDL